MSLFSENKKSQAKVFRQKRISQNDELKIYRTRMETVSYFLMHSSFIPRYVDPVSLHSSVSIYCSFSHPLSLPSFSFSFFLSFSLYLFLFTFLAAPLPYKLISRLPRTDGAEQLNSLFPFTYPFVSTFTFIFE